MSWVNMKFQASDIVGLSEADLDAIFANLSGKFDTVQAYGTDANLLTFFTRAIAEGYKTLYWPSCAGSYSGWPAAHNCNGTIAGWSDGDWLRCDITAARTAKIAAVMSKIAPLVSAGVLTGVTLDYCRWPYNAVTTYAECSTADITALATEYSAAIKDQGLNCIGSGTKGTNYVQMGQDWGTWLADGVIDICFMMSYCSRIYGDAMFDDAPQNDKDKQRIVEAPCGIAGKCTAYSQAQWDAMLARIVDKGYSNQVSCFDYGIINDGNCWSLIDTMAAAGGEDFQVRISGVLNVSGVFQVG